MNDPLAALDRARAAITALPDAEVRGVLSVAVDALLHGQDPREGLGLTGGEHAALCRAHRDHHLRTAAALLNEGKRWRRSKRLALEAQRFEAIQWPRWRKLEHPPAGASNLSIALWQARRWGPFPSSDMRFHTITGSV